MDVVERSKMLHIDWVVADSARFIHVSELLHMRICGSVK